MRLFNLPIVLSLLFVMFATIARAEAKPTLTTWYATCRHGPMCVASWEYPIGTHLSLFNSVTGGRAIGIVLDRGPDPRTGRNRKLDVSLQIAAQLGMIRVGVATIEVEVIGRM